MGFQHRDSTLVLYLPAQVWSGQVCVPDLGNVAVRCLYCAGMGDLAAMLGNQTMDVKGTVSALVIQTGQESTTIMGLVLTAFVTTGAA